MVRDKVAYALLQDEIDMRRLAIHLALEQVVPPDTAQYILKTMDRTWFLMQQQLKLEQVQDDSTRRDNTDA
jgi:hypothetical protein